MSVRRLRRGLAALVLGLAVGAVSCAPKTAAPPTPAAPKYPDFVFPATPEGIGTPATLERHKAGWQWLQAGDLKAADRNFTQALKLAADFYPAEAGLGYSQLARKAYDEALMHFDRAIVLNPRYAPALVGRGEALLARGEKDEALKSFEAALGADPDLGALRSRVEVLRFQNAQQAVTAARQAAESGRLGDARKGYEDAIAGSPQSPFLYRELAAVERRDNDLAAALVHAQKASELDPTDPRALVLTGEILEARGDTASAIRSYEAALALEPSDSLARRVDDLRERAAIAELPPEFHAIDSSPTITRAGLAALIGVRLDDLLRRANRGGAVLMTDTRASWAAPWILAVARAGVMEPYPNHTFQPDAIVRRSDLAVVASRALSLIAAERPALAARWREADRRRFLDVSQGHLSYPAVSLVVEAGVMQPDADGAFQLGRPVTGAEAVAAVRKLEELADQRTR